MVSALVGGLAAVILAGAAPEPCTVKDPATINAHCDLKGRIVCDAAGMCKPVFYWVAKSRQRS
jgi:hypothetical protein